MSRNKFNSFWKEQRSPYASLTEEKFAYHFWKAGRESMREEAAKVCGYMPLNAGPDQFVEEIIKIEL